MRLLVSVASPAEASAALIGGADLIDAKDPLAGALGAVSPTILGEIQAVCAGRRPVTAALGDADDESAIERTARTFATAGTRFVKVGFAGIADVERVAALIRATVRGARTGGDGLTGVVPVAYLDADRVASLTPAALLPVAARAGADGILIDTADKSGPGLRGLVTPDALAEWVGHAHEAGLFVAIAGQLTAEDLPLIRDVGADIAGVRGAACDGGRNGCVNADRVRALVAMCRSGSAAFRHTHDITRATLSAVRPPDPRQQ